MFIHVHSEIKPEMGMETKKHDMTKNRQQASVSETVFRHKLNADISIITCSQ